MNSKPGFDVDRLLIIPLSLSPERYQGQKVVSYLEEAKRQIERTSGVQSAAYTNGLPFAGANESIFWIEGRQRPRAGEEFPVVQYLVGTNYLQTLKIPLLKGRYFSQMDTTNQPPKVLIDEVLATKYFGTNNPVGQFIRLSEEFPPFEIVGVVGHVQHYGLDVTPPIDSQIYFAIPQIPDQFLSRVAGELQILIRTSGNPVSVIESVRAELKAIDPQQPVSTPVTMKQLIADSLAARRFSMALLSVFALVALFLAAAGIYGVLSYTVTQRSKEIGIRMAIGARKTDVLKLILFGGFRLIVIGLIIGIAGSLALSKFIASQLYAVSATDPSTFCLISILLTAAGLGATYVPASRAAKIDPISILKYE
jgi:putative ABC transport system permease protein